jgi:F0F1-type ATP synthase assembly protein I
MPADGKPRLAYARYGALALGMGWSVAAGALVGYYLDGYLGTSPLFTLVLTLGAVGGSLYNLITVLQRAERDEQQRADDRKD